MRSSSSAACLRCLYRMCCTQEGRFIHTRIEEWSTKDPLLTLRIDVKGLFGRVCNAGSRSVLAHTCQQHQKSRGQGVSHGTMTTDLLALRDWLTQ